MPNHNLYVAAAVSCMTGGLFGYSVGFIGGVLVLPSFLRHFSLDELVGSELASAQSSIVSVWLVGALFGVFLGTPVCSRLGRKWGLAFSAALYVSGAVLQLVDGGASLGLFEVGRLMNGLGVGAGTLVSPIYISEISPPTERGFLMSGYQVAIQLCALVGFWGAYASDITLADTSNLQWQIPVALQLFPGVILLLGSVLIIPESPRFLAGNGAYDDVRKSLSWLRALPEDSSEVICEAEEIESIAEATKRSSRDQVSGSSFLREAFSKPVRKRLGVGIGLMIAQNMVGLNALNYYAPVIFMSAGFTSVSSSLLLTGIFGVVKVISAAMFMLVFVRMRGNRFWLLLGSAICGISMFVLAYFVKMMPAPSSDDNVAGGMTAGGIVSILMVYVFAFAFGVSLGPISWNVCSEIFPSDLNAKCCAITTCTQWLFQIVIASITPHLIATVGWATYLLYGVFCVMSLVWCAACVPETRGVPLGKDMDDVFDQPDKHKSDVAVQEVEDINERSALLGQKRRRRSSIAIVV